MSCGKGAHYGYNCLPKVPIISNPEPCHDQNVDEFPQTLPSFHLTCYSRDENSFDYDSTPNFVNDALNVFNPPLQPPMYSYKFCGNDAHYGHGCPPQVPFIYNPKPYEFIKSSVENLVSNPSEFEDLSNIGCECDVPVCDDFTTFSNLLFDVGDNFSSSDDKSFFDEDVLKEIYSNPLFNEEIISIKIDPHHFNAESDLIKSLPNQDSFIISSSKIDSLFDEFAGELIFLKSITSGIDEADCDLVEEIRLIEKLLYDNSSPRPSKEINSKNYDVVIEFFSPSPIPVEDSDPFIEEIDLFLTSDGSIPPDYPIWQGILNGNGPISVTTNTNDTHHFNAESDLIESLLNQDSSIISSSKIDSLLDEFASELMFLKSIPLGIDEADCDPEEEIRIDSDYLDSEGDNLFPERLLHDDPIPLLDILDFLNAV
nr:hypothetical protein [Tanacetum cinerariifolium]